MSNTAGSVESVSLQLNVRTQTTFTISPTSFVYNGGSHGPTITPNPSNATYSVSGTASATGTGNYSVTATATGNYSGTATQSWSITPQNPAFTFSPTSFAYDGSWHGPTITPNPSNVTFSISGTASATNAGNYSVTATANGNFSGTATQPWSITARNTTFTISSPNFTYDGSSHGQTITPNPSNATYSVTGTLSATDAGNYSVTATANGNYSGTATQSWSIAPRNTTFTISPTSFTYTGGSQGPTITPNPSNATYWVSGTASATNPGSYSVTATANGNYTGTATQSWSISPPWYTLTVNNGTGGGSYTAGTQVNIYGNPPTGYHFTSWTLNSGPGTIGSSGSRSTTFTMGSGNATITANSANDAPTGWLDSASSPVIQNQNITGSGWAADNETGSPVSHVDILIDGVPPVPACQATLGGSRPDVASSYGRPDYTNSGYSFSYNIGTLSVGPHTISTKAYDAQGASAVLSGSRSFTVNAASVAPTITTQPSPQTITAGQNTSFTAAASGSPTPSVKWQVNTGTTWTDLANGGVYSGVSTNTLTLTQPPTSMSTYQFRLYAWNGVTPDATSSSATLTVNAAPPSAPVINSALTASATVNASFSYQITATNTPTSFSASGLPSGLSINTSTGAISGTPTTANPYNVSLGATNAGGTGTATLVITVTSGGGSNDTTNQNQLNIHIPLL
ncbi:MAG: MBG domain-containing protein [Opitutaceae bacterium]